MTEMEITVPDEVPVMTLPNTAFFPQALMPLYVFEPRYQTMLRDVLSGNRLLAIAGLDQRKATKAGEFEPPHRVASLGIVRAAQKNDNGTSNLLLQGICRVELVQILQESPYRVAQVQTLSSAPGATPQENEGLRREVARLLTVKCRLGQSEASEMTSFLKTVNDPEAFIDIAAFSLCENNRLKQKLLETLSVHRRLSLFSGQLRTEIEALKLHRKLQGKLPDDQVSTN